MMSKEKYDYLKSLNDYELVNVFNMETSKPGWVSERGRFMVALSDALEYKGISLENIAKRDEKGLIRSVSYRYPVYLWKEESKKVLVPITQSWREDGIYGEA